jgi:signal transduction histidine kinase
MGEKVRYAATLRSSALAHLVAMLVTALAAVVRFFLFGMLGDVEPYMPFIIAVMVAASYGGWKPGLLATALGAVAGVYLFVAPYFSLRIEEASEWVAVSQFLIAGATTSWLCQALHRVRRFLEAKQGMLEQEVKERQRAETAARESEGRLKEADRHKDEFLAMLAHELRNPLAPIRNAVRLLRLRGPKEPELQWGGEVIERQVDCLSRLIDDLLDVSRISRGKVELRKQRVGLAEIIKGAVESSSPLIDQYGHELSIMLPPEPIHVEADVVRLAQVFMNLLNNAAKYTKQGGHIWLSAYRQGSGVMVSVRDTGIGVSADKLPHLFEMFFQLEHSLEQSEGGLGIGLTLVRRLVEMHGGTVEARREGPGKGSEFLVWLPVVVDKPTLPRQACCATTMHGNEVQATHDGVTAKGFRST